MGSATRATWVTVATKKGLFGESPSSNALSAQADDFFDTIKKGIQMNEPLLRLVDSNLTMVIVHVVALLEWVFRKVNLGVSRLS